ncbi:MAG TPA: RNA-binding protein [Candidatus Mediterraneibacter faecigallinarum]|uniref:RNA-binding protein n=1 Tax=Candidatus Mediterraneibacter faecigallinarum TaxID=2838669 RepID=A0A9D2NU23_9FIRM|nr:RNA-binding protein [Candidatus Mediterraneibacter faecigallinarum]
MRYDYGYSYNYDMSNSVFAALMSIYLIIFMVALIFWIVEYVFFAIGLYTIAKRMGRNYPWLAFIPFARKYLHGELAGTIELKTRKIKNPGVWKLVLPIIAGAAFSLFMIILMVALGIGTFMAVGSYGYGISGGTIMLAVVLLLIAAVVSVLYQAVYKVLCVLINIQIYDRFTTHNMGIVHAVLSAVVPLYEAFCLFVMRHKEFNPGMEPKLTPPPAPLPPVYPGSPVPPEAGQPVNGQPVQPETAQSEEHPTAPVSERYTYAAEESESAAPAQEQPETEVPVRESGSENEAEQQKNDNMF